MGCCLSSTPEAEQCCSCRALCFRMSNLSEREDHEFLLHKGISQNEEMFEEVSDGNLQLGDILLFSWETYGTIRPTFKHAAVYCGNKEVIHYQVMDDRKHTGRISKEGYEAMKKRRGKCKVYRKKDAISVEEFNRRVREAMNMETKTDLSKNNSIYFALNLLYLGEFYDDLVVTVMEDPNQRDGAWTRRCNIM